MGEALQPGAWQTFAAISDLLKKWFSSLALSITHCCVAILFVASDDPHSLLHLFFFFFNILPKVLLCLLVSAIQPVLHTLENFHVNSDSGVHCGLWLSRVCYWETANSPRS